MEYMTVNEIVRSYKYSANKVEQVQILSDLTLLSTDKIIEILRDEGVLDEYGITKRICTRCGKEFPAAYRRGIPICPNCKYASARIARLEYKIRCNRAKIDEKYREVHKIHAKNASLRREINKLKETFK